MKKIVLINCYFGAFPSYFPLFLKSCQQNDTVDFLIFTDNQYDRLPKNVKLIPATFGEIRNRIQAKFDFEIVLDQPYKLCDYKPSYGSVFEEYIRGYDFWGYCDLDLIFGDLRKYLTEEKLEQYEKLYQLGHLTLYRNTSENNQRFMLDNALSYKDAFTTKIITVFDEEKGIQKIYSSHNIPVYLGRDYADITPKHFQFRLSDAFIEVPIAKNNYKYQVFAYEKGHVYRYYAEKGTILRDEFAYIHIQKRRMMLDGENECYYITNRGFVPKKSHEDVTIQLIKKLNPYEPLKEMKAAIHYILWRIKRKIRKIMECGK